jgi:hypothetical protein
MHKKVNYIGFTLKNLTTLRLFIRLLNFFHLFNASVADPDYSM